LTSWACEMAHFLCFFISFVCLSCLGS
jgi:hypothetical protein